MRRKLEPGVSPESTATFSTDLPGDQEGGRTVLLAPRSQCILMTALEEKAGTRPLIPLQSPLCFGRTQQRPEQTVNVDSNVGPQRRGATSAWLLYYPAANREQAPPSVAFCGLTLDLRSRLPVGIPVSIAAVALA